MTEATLPPMSQIREDGRWLYFGKPMIERRDALPCPRCDGAELEFNANVVVCLDCNYCGPDHGIDETTGRSLPEFMCDWREAIEDWNNAPERKLAEPWRLT